MSHITLVTREAIVRKKPAIIVLKPFNLVMFGLIKRISRSNPNQRVSHTEEVPQRGDTQVTTFRRVTLTCYFSDVRLEYTLTRYLHDRQK
jgi:hypothetical protein